MQKAIEKIKAEMNKEKNPYVQVVGEFMLRQLEKYPEAAKKILAADKTILKSLEEMRKVAEKKKVGNVAVLSDAEGFAVVLKSYGIDGQPLAFDVPVEQVEKPSVPDIDFDVSLDDFL